MGRPVSGGVRNGPLPAAVQLGIICRARGDCVEVMELCRERRQGTGGGEFRFAKLCRWRVGFGFGGRGGVVDQGLLRFRGHDCELARTMQGSLQGVELLEATSSGTAMSSACHPRRTRHQPARGRTLLEDPTLTPKLGNPDLGWPSATTSSDERCRHQQTSADFNAGKPGRERRERTRETCLSSWRSFFSEGEVFRKNSLRSRN